MIKVHIDNSPFQYASRIWIIQEQDGQRFVLRWDGKNWEQTKYQEGVDITPSLTFPFSFDQELFKALVDAISDRGIKPDAYSILEGEQKATKLHLQDMRTLVFKTPNPS